MKKIKRKNTANVTLKSEVIPTRKCARVPTKSSREAGPGTGEETKNPKFKKGKQRKNLMKKK
jgi:hypothetical protein